MNSEYTKNKKYSYTYASTLHKPRQHIKRKAHAAT